MKRALQQLIQEFQESTGDALPILDKKLNSKDRALAQKRDKYRTDEEHRQAKIAAARKWNKKNRARKLKNDSKWNKKNGAAAARAYRERKKKKAKG